MRYTLLVFFICSCHGYVCTNKPKISPKTLFHYWVAKNIKIPNDYKNDSVKLKQNLEYKTAKPLAFILCKKHKCILIIPEGSSKWNRENNEYEIIIGIAIKY